MPNQTTDQLLQALRSANPAVRRQAIIDLANSGDARGIDPLRKVAAADPDSSLRTLAQRAEQHLQKRQSRPVEVPTMPPPSKPSPYQPESWDQQASQLNSTLNDRVEQARGQLNNAYGSRASGDRAGAQLALAKALVLNPDLGKDKEVRDLAESLTGLKADQAIARLTAPPPKGGSDAQPRPEMADGCLVVVIELLIVFVLVAVFAMFSFNLIRQNMGSVMTSFGGVPAAQAATLRRAIDQLNAIPSSSVLLWALGVGFGVVLAFVIWTAIIHYFSTLLLSGSGDLVEFANAMTRIQIVSTLLSGVATIIPFLSLRSTTAVQSNIWSASTALSGAVSLGAVIAQIYFTSRIQRFDLLRGFVAVVVSPIILACGCCILIYVLTAFGGTTR